MPPAMQTDGSGSAQTGGTVSRAEASRARLAAQRERMAQQKAKYAAKAGAGAGLQRSESGASVQSTRSSTLERPAAQPCPGLAHAPLSPRPAAPASEPHARQPLPPLRPARRAGDALPGSLEDDRRAPGLQSRASGASDGSRSQSGSALLSPSGPRSRSAAIDVPTSPARARRSPRCGQTPHLYPCSWQGPVTVTAVTLLRRDAQSREYRCSDLPHCPAGLAAINL